MEDEDDRLRKTGDPFDGCGVFVKYGCYLLGIIVVVLVVGMAIVFAVCGLGNAH